MEVAILLQITGEQSKGLPPALIGSLFIKKEHYWYVGKLGKLASEHESEVLHPADPRIPYTISPEDIAIRRIGSSSLTRGALSEWFNSVRLDSNGALIRTYLEFIYHNFDLQTESTSKDQHKLLLEVLEELYPGEFDLQGNILILYFPEKEVTNSSGKCHTIKELYVNIAVHASNGEYRLRLNSCARTRLTTVEKQHGYTFSHARTGDLGTWRDLCLGSGNTAINVAHGLVYKTREELISFFMIVEGYFSWESLEGGPYAKFSSLTPIGDREVGFASSEIIEIIRRISTDKPVFTNRTGTLPSIKAYHDKFLLGSLGEAEVVLHKSTKASTSATVQTVAADFFKFRKVPKGRIAVEQVNRTLSPALLKSHYVTDNNTRLVDAVTVQIQSYFNLFKQSNEYTELLYKKPCFDPSKI